MIFFIKDRLKKKKKTWFLFGFFTLAFQDVRLEHCYKKTNRVTIFLAKIYGR